MVVLPGSELSAGIAPATLKLARGGQVRICSQSQLTINNSSQGLLLAMSAGAVEINYHLDESTSDLVVTPDFNIRLAGPGSYHFALGVNDRGDTCVKSLAGNSAGILFAEPLGSDQVGLAADETAFFPAGKLASRAVLDHSCGCPATAAPNLVASGQPETPSRAEDIRPERVLVANQEMTATSPAEQPGENHVQVETPFVFSAAAGTLPGGVAKIDFSSLPNVFLVQDEVEPVVLSVKAPPAPTPAAKPEPILAARAAVDPRKEPEGKKETKPEPAPAAQAAADPSKEPEGKKEKKGFMSRVKGFFGSIFHH
jgi:hypothetical protein